LEGECPNHVVFIFPEKQLRPEPIGRAVIQVIPAKFFSEFGKICILINQQIFHPWHCGENSLDVLKSVIFVSSKECHAKYSVE
jgi:hypothetical protein